MFKSYWWNLVEWTVNWYLAFFIYPENVEESGRYLAFQNGYLRVLVFRCLKRVSSMSNLRVSTMMGKFLYMAQDLKDQCYNPNFGIKYLCGVMSYEASDMIQWVIKTISGYYIKLVFNKFDLMHSTQCELNRVTLEKHIKGRPLYREFYCGRLPTWEETCPCFQINVTLTLAGLPYNDTFMILFFAVDPVKYNIYTFIDTNIYNTDGLPQVMNILHYPKYVTHVFLVTTAPKHIMSFHSYREQRSDVCKYNITLVMFSVSGHSIECNSEWKFVP